MTTKKKVTTKKKTVSKKPAAKKPAAKKVAVQKSTKYDDITSGIVDGVTVYKYKDYTSIKLAKIKRYVENDLD
jgi:hypothetical protein